MNARTPAQPLGPAPRTVPPTAAMLAARARTERLLKGPVAATLLALAAPNLVVMLAQAAANFLESYYVGLIGVDALAGAALVFPVVMLMQMMSAGGIGGGISSAVARAIGAGDHARAEALVLHAVVIGAVLGLLFTAAALLGGPWLYATMGGRDAALTSALTYSNAIFAGATLLWLLNAFASVLRGSGNMRLPAIVLASGVVLLVGVSPVLIFGAGPLPALGIAGAGYAFVLYYAFGVVILGRYLLRGDGGLRLRWRQPLRRALFADILGVGAVAVVNNVNSNLAVVAATAFVAPLGIPVLAGFGLGIRLEYLQVPIVFGFGTGMVAMIGMNVGAGQMARARQIAWTGAFMAAAATEVVGLAAALFPRAWLGLFTQDPAAIEAGSAYLRSVAPFYGLFGLGLALYFASQGARRMNWSTVAGLARLAVIVVLGHVAVTRLDGGLQALLAVLAAALFVFAGLACVPWIPRAVDRAGAQGAPAGPLPSTGNAR
ncbi:MAG: MATE family efflux transporter [Rhizobacter sp.]